MIDYIIRRMNLDDCEQVHGIEAATFAKPWSLRDFEHEMKENPAARYLVAESEGMVIAYAGIWVILDESHITNIAVSHSYRGNGIGRCITVRLLQYASNLGARYATLEVRRSNLTAQNLYRSLGFEKVGIRKKYYEDNGEDALIMALAQMPQPDPDFTEPETIFPDSGD